MDITEIQIKTKQGASGKYDAIIIKFNDMHFSKDLLGGPGGDRDIRRVKALSESLGLTIECHEPELMARIHQSLPVK